MAVSANRDLAAHVDWRPSSPEALRLAGWLRSERLTLLAGPDAPESTALLAAGVLPLLGRRDGDALALPSHVSAAVLEFPERRGRQAGATAEILVLFDAERERSVDLLKARLNTSASVLGYGLDLQGSNLADRIEAITQANDVRILFVVDRFQALLDAQATHPAAAALVSELVAVLERPLAANVLLAVPEPVSASMRQFTLRLTNPRPAKLELGTASRSTLPPRPELRLEAASANLAASDPASAKRNFLQAPTLSDVVEPAASRVPAPAARPALTPHRRLAGRGVAWLAGAIVIVGAAGALLKERGESRPAPASLAANPPAAAIVSTIGASAAPDTPLVAPAQPELELRVDAAGILASALPAELVTALGGNVALRPVEGTAARLSSDASDPPHLAIVSYDELRAAATGPLQVMAPLATELVVVLVRQDSPLRFFHDLAGKRINAGPAQGSRAVTANLLYRRMFNAPLPPTPAGTAKAPAAMRTLLDGASLDAVLLLGSQSHTVIAAMPESMRRAYRPLALDPAHPVDRKALQAYLPATLARPGGSPVPTLASLSFLVATGAGGASLTARLSQLTDSLCLQLPRLQRNGDPAWRQVQAGLQPPIGIRGVDTTVLDSTWARCQPLPVPP